jgi:hypothetical protein
MGTLVPMLPVPPLPGAINSFLQSGLCFIFQASACSRPPDPRMSMFIKQVSKKVGGEIRRKSCLGLHFLPILSRFEFAI